MSEQPQTRRTSPWIVWPVCMFFFVVFYLASFGPVWGLWANDRISGHTYQFLCDTVYFPIYSINDNTEFFHDNPIGRAYMSYVDWFEP